MILEYTKIMQRHWLYIVNMASNVKRREKVGINQTAYLLGLGLLALAQLEGERPGAGAGERLVTGLLCRPAPPLLVESGERGARRGEDSLVGDAVSDLMERARSGAVLSEALRWKEGLRLFRAAALLGGGDLTGSGSTSASTVSLRTLSRLCKHRQHRRSVTASH